MDLNDLLVFERVVAEGSFTAAARTLGLAKSTVSERIARLEDRLGVRLLQRSTRALRPTADGAAYYERCARIVAEAREADAALTGARERPLGTLRVTAARLFGQAFLTPVTADYLARYPEVAVELLLAERHVDLVDEGFDLAIRLGALDDSTLVSRRLGEAPLRYAASPDYLAHAGEPRTPDDLQEHHLVVVAREREPARWPFSTAGGPRAVRVEGRVRVNDLPMARDLALRGAGIAMLPVFMSAADIASGALVEVLSGQEPPPLPVVAVYPSSRHLSARVRAFVDLLVEHTRDAMPWAPGSTPGPTPVES